MGEKLRPVGLGAVGADYDGQAQAREQGKDDATVPEADHVEQTSHAKDCTSVNMDFAERNYDLYVRVSQLHTALNLAPV